MGNHEFCVRCGASDFHRGQTCEEAYPEKLKEKQEREDKLKKDQIRASKKLKKLTKEIEAHFGVRGRLKKIPRLS